MDNHEAVTRFAARGVGEPGNQPVWAPLSDPGAKPGEEYLPAVNAGALPAEPGLLQPAGAISDACLHAGLRHVAHALLVGPEAKQASPHRVQHVDQGCPGRPVAVSFVVQLQLCLPLCVWG